jgi:hypothetical protein
MNETLDTVAGALGKLNGMPGYMLIFILCIGVTKGLRSLARFPNGGVWLSILLFGAVLNSLIADPTADNLGFRVWLVKNAVFGGIVGFVSLMAYNLILKRFGWFSGDAETKPTPPAP